LKRFAGDPAIDKLQSDVMKGGLLLSLEPGQVEKVRQLVTTKGDAKRGREVYLNTKLLACATCHRMEGVGGNVGPDLTRIWETMTVEKLLEAVVDPSKEIKEGFQTYRVVTADGQVQTGLKVSETAKEVVLRDANGRDLRLAKDDIESITPSKVSLMPDNAAANLSFDQFVDLLAFLKSRKEQESLRGMVVEARVAGPYPAGLTAATPEVKGDDTAARWQTYQAEASGVLDLKGAFPSDAPSGVYVRAFVYSPKKQAVSGSLAAEDPLRVWVNGSSAFVREKPKADAAADETFQAELNEGWNVVLVKVANGGKTHRLALRLTGEGLRTAPTPEDVPAPKKAAGQR
ncbi:MAG: c-type cytochrome, partial [Gemmataceae bacterium]|nr:c-type cytochrome [Gemmataceae bacterium]